MSEHTRCPSSDCHAGAVLIGIVLPGGRVAMAADEIIVDEEFVRIAREQPRPPEQRFRFSTTCVKSGCRQWDNRLDGVGGCSLIDRLMDAFKEERGTIETEESSLPKCSIRDECRWYKQRGGAACSICPDVVTDTTTTENDLPPRVRHARINSRVETTQDS
jgi:hypothetical protein